ncbi:hypothetical protein [Pseudomonas aeruginosa]|nr:hypothetical protein [Pseudomonas aeruginosa]
MQITPSQFVQWMIDRLSKQASQEMLQELKEMLQELNKKEN